MIDLLWWIIRGKINIQLVWLSDTSLLQSVSPIYLTLLQVSSFNGEIRVSGLYFNVLQHALLCTA